MFAPFPILPKLVCGVGSVISLRYRSHLDLIDLVDLGFILHVDISANKCVEYLLSDAKRKTCQAYGGMRVHTDA